MRIFKPMSLGLLHKPYRHQGRDRLVITTLGFFRLGAPVQGFLTENLQWPDVLKALPQGEPLDLVMPKPRAEYLLAATAFAPDGVPLNDMEVSVRVGDLNKFLRVYGDREWRYGLLPWHGIDAPQPFSEMPIEYARAYGGEDHPANPLGVGYTGSRFGAFVGTNQGAMPNIEYAHEQLEDHHRQHPPAGFLPLDIRWQPRARKLGTYDQAWLEQDFPGLAQDLDWDAFSTAPEDQQLDGWFQGGEPYRIEGMHPDKQVLEGQLPDMRTRAFVLRKGVDPDACEEVDLYFDTVWFFPEFELGVALYRGQTVIADSEAEDVEAVMVGYEHNSDPAKGVAHYREVLGLRMDPETCVLHALNDAQLTPRHSAEECHARQQEQAQAETEYLAKQQVQLDEATADFWAESGKEMPADFDPPKAELPPLGLTPKAAIERADLDLTEMMAKAKVLTDEAEQKRLLAMKELAAEREGRLKPLTEKAAALLPDEAEQLRQAAERAAKPATDLRQAAASATGAEHGGPLMNLLDKVQSGDTELSAEERGLLDDSLARLPALQRQARRLAPQAIPEAPLPAVAEQLGRLMRGWHAGTESLAGRDLSGADLTGIDFRGADLREVMLEHADLRGVCFADANLAGAVFTAAQLQGADFSDADLSEANLSQAQAEDANFRGACLDGVMAMEGDFHGADFSGASLSKVVLQKINLADAILDATRFAQAMLHEIEAPRSQWRGAQFELSIINAAQLAQADLSHASFDSCVMMQLQAEQSVWRGAQFVRVFAGGDASLQRADLRDVRASHSSWRDADLRGADLSHTGLLDCDFGGADLSGSRLVEALLSRSLFIRTRLCDCDARGAEFFQAMLRKADLSRADLRDANLVQANLFEAVLADADLRGARPHPLGRAA